MDNNTDSPFAGYELGCFICGRICVDSADGGMMKHFDRNGEFMHNSCGPCRMKARSLKLVLESERRQSDIKAIRDNTNEDPDIGESIKPFALELYSLVTETVDQAEKTLSEIMESDTENPEANNRLDAAVEMIQGLEDLAEHLRESMERIDLNIQWAKEGTNPE